MKQEKLCGFFLSRELPVFCDLFLDSTAIALENFFTLRNLAKMGCMQRGLIAVKWGKTHFFLNTFLVIIMSIIEAMIIKIFSLSS